jgi:hypothetical protein
MPGASLVEKAPIRDLSATPIPRFFYNLPASCDFPHPQQNFRAHTSYGYHSNYTFGPRGSIQPRTIKARPSTNAFDVPTTSPRCHNQIWTTSNLANKNPR